MVKTDIKDGVLIQMFKKMIEIRFFEEKVEALFLKGLIGGSVHLYIGQEAVAVGACSALKEEDYIISTHRGHGHCIAKGGKIERIMAEILGRKQGYCKGKGGSMHVSDIDTHNLGANGIVGAGIPIATGAALALKLKGEKHVIACFFGDGAANTGAFHEGINLASIWKLPVIFICENNCYAVSVPVCKSFGISNISMRGQSYGIPGITVNGMNAIEIYQAVKKSAEKARNGEGPSLIECLTYRFKGHFVGDPCAYRTKEELLEWQGKDPIKTLQDHLLQHNMLTREQVADIEREMSLKVTEAEKFALTTPEPSPGEAFSDIYAD